MNIKFGDKIELMIDDIILTGKVTGTTISEDSREYREYFYIDLDTAEEWSLSLSKITAKEKKVEEPKESPG